jgi:hypothetical protein
MTEILKAQSYKNENMAKLESASRSQLDFTPIG